MQFPLDDPDAAYDAFLDWLDDLPDAVKLQSLHDWMDDTMQVSGWATRTSHYTAYGTHATITYCPWAAYRKYMFRTRWPAQLQRLRAEFNDAMTERAVDRDEARREGHA